MQAPLSERTSDYTAPDAQGRRALRRAGRVLVAGLVGTLVCLPLDGTVARLAASLQDGTGPRLGGDFKRELEFVQQFGAFTSVVLIWTAILLMDVEKRRLIASFLLGVAANSLTVNALKMTLGRPRPKLKEPMTFTLPWETFVAEGDERIRRAWEMGAPGASELWSMPSSHTAAAAMLAVFLARMYPRLMPLAIGLACVVGAARVILWAHYPSDVVAGGTIGAAIGILAHDMRWGARLVPRAWRESGQGASGTKANR